MTESTTEVYNSTISRSKFELSSLLTDTCRTQKNVLAVPFAYKSNCSREDLAAVRRLLTLELQSQDPEEFEFRKSDYERMMKDDWLVTRFLLRGKKRTYQLRGSSNGDDESKYEYTLDLIRSCAKFRYDYRVNGSTHKDEFPPEWTCKDGLFNYKPDLAGNPTIYMRIKLHKPKLIETKEAQHEFKRLMLYTLECCDRDLYNKPGQAICCVFDMTGAMFENVDLELISWMIKSFKTSSPKLLCYAIVYNLPWFFSATFKLISKTLMSTGNKQGLRFVYGDEILNYIDRDNLPQYLNSTL